MREQLGKKREASYRRGITRVFTTAVNRSVINHCFWGAVRRRSSSRQKLCGPCRIESIAGGASRQKSELEEGEILINDEALTMDCCAPPLLRTTTKWRWQTTETQWKRGASSSFQYGDLLALLECIVEPKERALYCHAIFIHKNKPMCRRWNILHNNSRVCNPFINAFML